ncbi:MAG TPA: succinate dehydrogenase, hydrophobic membrane anchor protein [Acetobacteraceae bacterium]|nr:succinate dehydrogenase, hydrophobic membrane anchor protein [Acetobacteraceae bacterium]
MAQPGKSVRLDVLRSELGRVRGLGAARSGSGHWWLQRLTSIALVPLTLWFIASAMRLEGATRSDMITWLHGPVPLTLMLCLAVTTFWHMELGLRVVVEDYVHQNRTRLTLLLLIRTLCIVAAVLCVISALRLGL